MTHYSHHRLCLLKLSSIMARGPSFIFFFLLFLCNAVTSSDIPLSHAKDFEIVLEKKQLFPSIHRALIEYFSYRRTELDPPTTALPSPPITIPVTAPPINDTPGIVTVPGTNPPVTNPVNPPVTNPVNPPVINPVNPPIINPMNPPVTNPVNSPVTNPVNSPVTNPVNSPVTNPVNPPVTNPVNPPVTNPMNPPATNPVNPPITNPVNPPVTNPVNPPITNPVNPPVTNPVNPPITNPVNPPVTNPVNPPVPVTNPGSGRWCIAKNGASQAALQSAVDYACGTGGADCASIQQGSSCYEPATLENHASYAFNSYYQKNPTPTSCDFGGAATVTTTNPSAGSCVYPSSSPPTQSPVNPSSPPTTSSSGPGTQYPPPPPTPGFNLGSPDPTRAFGASPPLPSVSKNPRSFIGYLSTVVYIIMFGL